MFDEPDFSKINLGEMLGQVKQMATQANEDNAQQIFTAKVGGGMIQMSINGNSEVIDLQIDDSLLQDKDALQILLISAVNDLTKQADEFKRQVAMKMMSKFAQK